ncbi:MAG: LytTR family DNA-binding domain-containing protein [Saprospiraceae bacterium]|nr:response regulator transcription factor [Lewinella sp.]
MKLRSLIIDDEPLAHKVILEYAKDVSLIEIVGQCYLATEALPLLSSESIDLIFLDIHMPKLKGLDFLKSLHRKPIVIITSAYGEYALESFELDVCDYLLKPIRFERFVKAVQKAVEWHGLRSSPSKVEDNSPATLPQSPQSEFFLKVDRRLIQMNTEEIYYLESYGNYVKVWYGKDFHLSARTLSSFEEELLQPGFFRVHKSFIIHKKYIDFVEGNRIMMRNGTAVPIGKSYRADFRAFIGY